VCDKNIVLWVSPRADDLDIFSSVARFVFSCRLLHDSIACMGFSHHTQWDIFALNNVSYSTCVIDSVSPLVVDTDSL